MDCVIVIGLGSMGKRRIRLMRQINPSLTICGVDGQIQRCNEVSEQFHIPCYTTIAEAIERQVPEAGFVCTSPLAHRGIITYLLKKGLHVFTEINLVKDGYEEMMALARNQGKTLFLSSTFLYRKDVGYLISQSQGKTVNYIIHTGQYLPDWHPWENYQTYFVGDKRTNGCREILAIDLPWVLAAFGPVIDVHVRKSKNTALKLNYPDNYIISMEHENGSTGVFVCDVVSRLAGRSADIFNEDTYLRWRGTPDSLTSFDVSTGGSMPVTTYTETIDHQSGYSANIIENAYRAEIDTFFAVVAGRMQAPYTFEDDLYTIGLIDQIEGEL